jgi:hypothetical protein
VKYPIPLNEVERLALRREYRVLDTSSEQAYDDVVALAARICGASIPMASLRHAR